MPLVRPILTKESGACRRNHCVSTSAASRPAKPLHAAREKLTSIMESPGPETLAPMKRALRKAREEWQRGHAAGTAWLAPIVCFG